MSCTAQIYLSGVQWQDLARGVSLLHEPCSIGSLANDVAYEGLVIAVDNQWLKMLKSAGAITVKGHELLMSYFTVCLLPRGSVNSTGNTTSLSFQTYIALFSALCII